MKKYFYYLLLPLLLFTLVNCVERDDTDYVDYDTIATVYDLKNASFEFDPNAGPDASYTISREFGNPIYGGDVILIYRMSDTTNNGSPVWQQIPRTLYLNEGELDYDFDFSKYDFIIKAGGDYDISTTPSYITNQTFRIVVVPGSSTGTTKIDYSNYEAVAEHLNLDNTPVKIL